MIPNSENYDEELEDEIDEDFTIENEPSLTYSMNLDRSIFIGKIDETEAVRQAAIKILNTERYENEIYSWDYGIELKDLIGTPFSYAMSEVKERITDALTADDRIEAVEDFEVERTGKHSIHVSFTVVTAQKDEIKMESEVEI